MDKKNLLDSGFVSSDTCRAFNTFKLDLVFFYFCNLLYLIKKDMVAQPLYCGPYLSPADELIWQIWIYPKSPLSFNDDFGNLNY